MGEVHITISFGEAEKGARNLVDTAMSGKKERSDVAYRDAPHEAQSCQACGEWEGTDQATEAPCRVVGGEVEADAVCDLFTPKPETNDDVPRKRRVSDDDEENDDRPE